MNKGPLTFQELLLGIRESEKISQKDFSEKLEISKQHLCDIEKGRRIVSIKRGVLFAKKLGFPPKTFVSLMIQDQLRGAGLDLEVKMSVP